MITKQQIKEIRMLHQKKFRTAAQRFFIEGEKMWEECRQFAPHLVDTVFVTKNVDQALFKGFATEEIEERQMRQLSALKTPNNVFALLHIPKTAQLLPDANNLNLILDDVQDPGNLGTIIRLAAWYGVRNIFASPQTADCFNPKVVQASMGAVFHVDVFYTDLQVLLAQNKHLPVYGATMEGQNIYTTTIKNGFLVLGNEGHGISNEIINSLTTHITIPKFGHGESLNVAMAASVFLHEFRRGRE